jgi:hypothetical protein
MRIFHELVTRADAAGPLLALGIETELVGFRRVDAVETNFCLTNLDGVTVDDARLT